MICGFFMLYFLSKKGIDMEILLIVLIALCAVTLVLTLVSVFKKPKAVQIDDEMIKTLNAGNKADIEKIYNLIQQQNQSQLEIIKLYNQNVIAQMDGMNKSSDQKLNFMAEKIVELSAKNDRQMEKLIVETRENLMLINENNSKKLDEMRVIVDDKLNQTLSDRLNKSFAIVSEQLQAVTKGLGEMQSLASGVGDLKKVLTNVKTRGTFGEVQLGQLLEQMLAPNQFVEQVMVKENSTERVDFAVLLPGKDNQNILLPIDAKFPVEDYIRLIDASDRGSQDDVASAQKQLVKRVKEEAKAIKEKYIQVPKTTDFAILYLPTEGLYAEVIKNTGLFEELQRDYKITVCGPTTLSAFLNSLQMGFKTLAIEKRSSEIWTMLTTFKKEFSTYVELLTKTQKKLAEANDTIENATKKSAKIQKQLSQVDDIDPTGQLE